MMTSCARKLSGLYRTSSIGRKKVVGWTSALSLWLRVWVKEEIYFLATDCSKFEHTSARDNTRKTVQVTELKTSFSHSDIVSYRYQASDMGWGRETAPVTK